MAIEFARKASIKRARLKAAFCGPSKSGKTFDALALATSLSKTLKEHNNLKGNGRILVICSEGGRAEEQYADIFDFDIYVLADFSPEAYMDALADGIKEDYSVIVIDQISHEWAGKNGMLERKTIIEQQSGGKFNNWTAWSVATPMHNKFIEALVRCPVHLICTMRVKTDWQTEVNGNGKVVPVKMGLAPVQRDNTEYEFDIVGTIDMNHILSIETRGSLSRLLGDRKFMPGKNVDDPGEINQIGQIIGTWISDRSSVQDLGFASREQIEEIQGLGERLGMAHKQWKETFTHYKISSLNSMTQEIYERIKKSWSAEIAKREAAKAKSKSQV